MGFGGWHGGGYCGCGGGCQLVAWWICWDVSDNGCYFFFLGGGWIFKIYFTVVVIFQTQKNEEEERLRGKREREERKREKEVVKLIF